jgi:glutathione S-transferase
MITLYHDNLSVCAQKVRIVLAEKNQPWTNHHVNLAAAERAAWCRCWCMTATSSSSRA